MYNKYYLTNYVHACFYRWFEINLSHSSHIILRFRSSNESKWKPKKSKIENIIEVNVLPKASAAQSKWLCATIKQYIQLRTSHLHHLWSMKCVCVWVREEKERRYSRKRGGGAVAWETIKISIHHQQWNFINRKIPIMSIYVQLRATYTNMEK